MRGEEDHVHHIKFSFQFWETKHCRSITVGEMLKFCKVPTNCSFEGKLSNCGPNVLRVRKMMVILMEAAHNQLIDTFCFSNHTFVDSQNVYKSPLNSLCRFKLCTVLDMLLNITSF